MGGGGRTNRKMMGFLHYFFLASCVIASPPATPIGAGQPYWLKVYSVSPYKEFWTADLVCPRLNSDKTAILRAIEKAGGKLTQPLSNFASNQKEPFQQLSFSVSRAGAETLRKSFKKFGVLSEINIRPSGISVPLDEIKIKIDKLMKEKAEHAGQLAQVPVAAAIADEALEHLLMVEEMSRKQESEILFNLTLRQN